MKRTMHWTVLVAGAATLVWGLDGSIWIYGFGFAIGATAQTLY